MRRGRVREGERERSPKGMKGEGIERMAWELEGVKSSFQTKWTERRGVGG